MYLPRARRWRRKRRTRAWAALFLLVLFARNTLAGSGWRFVGKEAARPLRKWVEKDLREREQADKKRSDEWRAGLRKEALEKFQTKRDRRDDAWRVIQEKTRVKPGEQLPDILKRLDGIDLEEVIQVIDHPELTEQPGRPEADPGWRRAFRSLFGTIWGVLKALGDAQSEYQRKALPPGFAAPIAPGH